MGSDPKTSVLNRYLQRWDVHNVFVMGASAFPQGTGYYPTGPRHMERSRHRAVSEERPRAT
jgi:choline dehydrogenase-like flavoprotein